MFRDIRAIQWLSTSGHKTRRLCWKITEKWHV